MRKIPLLLIIVVLVGAVASAQEETPPQDGVNVTVYNQGSALVQDRRTFEFIAGDNTINFTDVAASIDATSVSFNSITDPAGTYVVEQNYVYDLVDTYALLERYLDQTIQVTTNDGTVYVGELLSGRSGDIILRKDTGEVVVVNVGNARDIQFPNLPDGLITRPTLRWQIFSTNGGSQQVELTYLTSGISWTADYTVLLANDNRQLDLNGWITLSNSSGTSYQDAVLKLIAGDVNRLPTDDVYARSDGIMMAEAAAAPPAPVEQRNFNEYKLYEIPRPVTIGNNETKQVQFVSGADIPANAFYVYDSSPYFYNYGYAIQDQYYGQTGITDVQNYLEFTTAEENGVGAALPAGRIRVYQEDIDGSALLIGENSIDHTPKGEDVQIYLGNAFDLVGERVQSDFRLISSNVLQETYQITLKNHKEDQSVEIRIPEHLFRWSNWEILNNSLPYEKLDSNTIEFRVIVEPDSEITLTYTVQYSWPF